MNNLDLGLKDFFISSRKNKPRLRHFFRELRWELRYALRRAWIGYDDVDMFECFEMFRRNRKAGSRAVQQRLDTVQ